MSRLFLPRGLQSDVTQSPKGRLEARDSGSEQNSHQPWSQETSSSQITSFSVLMEITS